MTIKIDANYFDTIELEKAQIEQLFNTLGHIPFLSTFSGVIRTITALEQLFYDSYQFSEHYIQAVTSPTNDEYEYHKVFAKKLYNYFNHDGMNFFRGVFEAVPGINLTCLFYDYLGYRQKYTVETDTNKNLIKTLIIDDGESFDLPSLINLYIDLRLCWLQGSPNYYSWQEEI